jgi:pimeloyl-ACP methyl ester carboxylesterase
MPLLLKDFTDHTINTGEINIGYSIGPDNGPTLLLLHGATSRRDTFMRVMDSITPNYRVIAMDQRGHGYSDHTPGHYLTDDHTRDIQFVLKNICKEPSIVWGHSMGGRNALVATDGNPGLVKALIIEDSGFRRGAATMPGNLPVAVTFRAHLALLEAGLSLEELTAKLKEMSPDQPDYFAPWKAEVLLQMDIEFIRNSVSGGPRGTGDAVEMLSKIDIPFLYMQADPDAGGSNTDDILDEIIPKRGNFTVKKIVGATHNINREHPEQLLPVVLPWLAGLRQSS